jgi:endogenous inhibitor of DNA gyrase (YacG/DUF329 family)
MTDDAPLPRSPARTPRCPICGKPQADRFRPFCSQRCAEVDLHRWLSGAYAIPGSAEDDDAGPAAADGDSRDP